MSYSAADFGNIAMLKAQYPSVDVDRVVADLCKRLNSGGESVRSADGLLRSWVRATAEREGATPKPPVVEQRPELVLAYGKFRTNLILRILNERLTPSAVAMSLMAAKMGEFAELIGDEEIKGLTAMGETWPTA